MTLEWNLVYSALLAGCLSLGRSTTGRAAKLGAFTRGTALVVLQQHGHTAALPDGCCT